LTKLKFVKVTSSSKVPKFLYQFSDHSNCKQYDTKATQKVNKIVVKIACKRWV